MPFKLAIPQPTGSPISIVLDTGDILFVLGSNGSGKSNLMHRVFSEFPGETRRISAHRQNWFDSNGITLSSEQRRQAQQNILAWDVQQQSRWRDNYASYRTNIALYDIVDGENVRARSIASAIDSDDVELAKNLSRSDAPIKVINELLTIANIPIQIQLEQNDRVVAIKRNGPPYSIAELSDGERNALLVASEVLTVQPGTLILIDEPERHLHRSIISPLLTELFQKRRDCVFIVSTHEVMLPMDNPASRTLLLRECIYSGNMVSAWDADLIPTTNEIADDIKKEILGARRRILFIEGEKQSLDNPLYNLIFPNVSIIPKASSRDVENAVVAIRSANDLHWLRAFGIVDNDGRTPEDIADLKRRGIYVLSVFSVESIYYHPQVQLRVVERHAAVVGGDATVRLAEAKSSAITAIKGHRQRLSERVVERTLRESIMSSLPGQPEIAAGTTVSIVRDVAAFVAAELQRLDDAISVGNLEELIERYPVRETSALTDIARKLGFQSRRQYEEAVLKLLIDDPSSLQMVQGFLCGLPTDLDQIS